MVSATTFRQTRRLLALAVVIALVAALQIPSPAVVAQESDPQGSQGGSEVTSQRTEMSRTYRNANGTFTTELSTGPVNFRGSDGRWHPIDTSLVASDEDGYGWSNERNSIDVHFKEQLRDGYLRLDIAGLPFSLTADEASASRAERSATGNVDPPREQRNDDTIDSSAAVASSSPGPGTQPTVDPTTAATAGSSPTPTESESPSDQPSPPESVGPKRNSTAARHAQNRSQVVYPGAFPWTDLRYDVIPGGIKETLVISRAGAPTHYRFLL
jgi:hypothetical protein